MSPYILIITMYWAVFNGDMAASVATAEFSSQSACIKAAQEWKSHPKMAGYKNSYYVCAKKD